MSHKRVSKSAEKAFQLAFLKLKRRPLWADELYLPKEPKNIQLASILLFKYGDAPSPSTGDLCIYVPQMTSLMFDLSRDQAPLSYLSDQKPSPLPIG